jgi:hypothetical protein
VPKWLPLMLGVVLTSGAVLGVIAWQVASGHAAKTRGLVVTNLRPQPVVVTLSDGQSARLLTDGVATFVIEKAKFPLTARATDDAGALLFEQQLDYAALSEANFRVAVTDSGIVAPSLPGPASPTAGTSG